jgi:pimeloyl-ACP methyl ester carboxylesterase
MTEEVTRLTVPVNGADIFAEVSGSGPPVLMLPGGVGIGRGYPHLNRAFSADHTVISYDRRGHGRSSGTPTSIAQHADDAVAVMLAATQSANNPLVIIASSAGAVVGLDLVARNPGFAHLLIAHEPPVVTLLPDSARWLALAQTLINTNDFRGTIAAYDIFIESIATGATDLKMMALPDALLSDWDTLFRAETEGIFGHHVDLRAIRAGGTAILPIAGVQSRGYFHSRTAIALAEALDVEFHEIRGSHVAPMVDQHEFASDVRALIAAAI